MIAVPHNRPEGLLAREQLGQSMPTHDQLSRLDAKKPPSQHLDVRKNYRLDVQGKVINMLNKMLPIS
jgi:hypothetical protein